MDITNPNISATQAGERWTITVRWTETFTATELSSGFEFEDWVTYWEWDDTDHDHLANSGVGTFQPSSLQINRFHIWPNIHEDVLDTELGGEELRGQIFLRNRTTSSVAINRGTPILQISPG